MASARGNNKEAYINPYELQKMAMCARNKQRFDELKLAQCAKDLQQQSQPRKRIKKSQEPREVAPNNHNLRPRPEKPSPEIAIANEEIAAFETIGDFLSDNEDMHSTKKKRKGGRKVTRMDDILLKEPGTIPKIKIELNKEAQPIGDNYRKLSSCIGVRTRKMVPVGYTDWRLVDANLKNALWKDIKKRFDIDDQARDWVLNSAGSKWKQFKAKLKKEIFDETLTDEEMKNLHVHRIDPHELESLLKIWRSPESQALAERGKKNRAKLKFLHTSGSVSYAATAHTMGKKLGRLPRRDEVFVQTHTSKNGVPLSASAVTIGELKEAIELYPELKDKTIQEGDAFAVVCGLKEPKGRVRCLGLGPTPQDIGIPGAKGYKSTRLQVEILARQDAENENLLLRQRILEMEQREEQRMTMESANVEIISQHGSNSRQHVSPRYEEVAEANQPAQGEEDEYVERDRYDNEADEQVASPAASPAMNITSPRNDGQHSSRDALAGKEVILFAMSSDEKVAKATIVSVNPKNMIDGVALGKKFCEVIVDLVLRRDALVPRPYAEIRTVGDALNMQLAWPFNRLKICSPRPRAQGVAGSSQGASQGAARLSQRR